MGGRFLLRNLASMALALAALASSLAVSPEDDLPGLVRRVEPSVVLVQTFASSGKKLAQGSGFFVDTGGDVVTSHHVVLDASRVQVKIASGRTFDVTGVVAQDRSKDLVRLAVAMPAGTAVPLGVAASLPEPGQTVVVIGSPLGLEQTVTDGIVSAIRTLRPMGTVIQMSAPISPGSSGSPVVNLAGQVVGVAAFLRQDGQNLNFAVPAKALLDLTPGPPRPLSTLSDRRGAAPDPSERAYLTGVAFLTQRSYARALPFFKAAAKVNPSYAEAFFQMGACLEGLGREEDAAEAYQTAVLLKPEAADFHLRLGAALQRTGRLSEACEAYLQASTLFPGDTGALVDLARCYLAMGQAPKALQACQQAVRTAPATANAYETLGQAYLQTGRFDLAQEAFRQAVRQDPDSAESHCGMGRALYETGRNGDAAAAFKEAIRLNPKSTDAHFGLGLSALASGNRGLALEEYKVLKSLDPARAEKLFERIY